MRQLTEIIVHCSATRPDWMAGASINDKAAEIKRWHVEGNGWRDIGYHYLIDRDGSGAKGRADSVVGAHVKGRNKTTIGICLMGGHGSSENDTFSQNFTAEQDAALRALINALIAKYGPLKVTGHNQFAAKACPGFHVPTWYNGGAVARKTFVPKEVETLIDKSKGKGADSTTILTSVTQLLTAGGATALAAFKEIDPMVAIAMVAGVVIIGGVYIVSERRKKDAAARAAEAALNA